jgi:hypothetical protein
VLTRTYSVFNIFQNFLIVKNNRISEGILMLQKERNSYLLFFITKTLHLPVILYIYGGVCSAANVSVWLIPLALRSQRLCDPLTTTKNIGTDVFRPSLAVPVLTTCDLTRSLRGPITRPETCASVKRQGTLSIIRVYQLLMTP